MCELDYKATSDTDNNPEKLSLTWTFEFSTAFSYCCLSRTLWRDRWQADLRMVFNTWRGID